MKVISHPEPSKGRSRARDIGLGWSLALALSPLRPEAVDAGAWTLPQGRVWTKASCFRQTAKEWYIASPEPVLRPDGTFTRFATGTRRPYRFDGRYRSRAVFLEAFYGVTDRVEAGLQVPFFDQDFDDDTRSQPPAAAGFSDLRLCARWRLARSPLVLALKVGAKLPTGEFRNQDGLIPVGEGQWDMDLTLQAGRSLWPAPVWASLDIGYRVRLKNRDTDLDPGDEGLVDAEIGWAPTRRLWLAMKLESVLGRTGRVFGLQNPSLTRRITYMAPTASLVLFGATALEGAVRFTAAGRNYPAGHQLVLGLTTTLDAARRARPP